MAKETETVSIAIERSYQMKAEIVVAMSGKVVFAHY